MTDKEKIRAEIERQITELTPTKEKIGIVGGVAVKRHLESILSFIDSMQEEPVWIKELQDKLDSLSKEDFDKIWAKYDKYDKVEESVTSVWHEPSEIPEEKKWILLAHKDGWYHVGRLYEGQRGNLVISDGVSTFELNMFNKWVYVDDILKF